MFFFSPLWLCVNIEFAANKVYWWIIGIIHDVNQRAKWNESNKSHKIRSKMRMREGLSMAVIVAFELFLPKKTKTKKLSIYCLLCYYTGFTFCHLVCVHVFESWYSSSVCSLFRWHIMCSEVNTRKWFDSCVVFVLFSVSVSLSLLSSTRMHIDQSRQPSGLGFMLPKCRKMATVKMVNRSSVYNNWC